MLVLLSTSTQMVPSLDGTFELTDAWQLPGGQMAAYTFPIKTGTVNEASKVSSITGALAFTVSLASMLSERPGL